MKCQWCKREFLPYDFRRKAYCPPPRTCAYDAKQQRKKKRQRDLYRTSASYREAMKSKARRQG